MARGAEAAMLSSRRHFDDGTGRVPGGVARHAVEVALRDAHLQGSGFRIQGLGFLV